MLGISIWIFYSLSLWWFFITTLDNQKKKPIWEWVLAVFPPLASSIATFGYYYWFDNIELSRWFALFWCFSILCCLHEVWDARKLGKEMGALFAMTMAAAMIAVTFGPGLFLGYAWIMKWQS